MFKTSKWAMGRTLVHPIYCKGTLFYVSMTLLGSDGIYLGYTGLLPLRGDELWKTESHWLKNLWMHPRHKILRTKMKPPETLQVGALTRIFFLHIPMSYPLFCAPLCKGKSAPHLIQAARRTRTAPQRAREPPVSSTHLAPSSRGCSVADLE